MNTLFQTSPFIVQGNFFCRRRLLENSRWNRHKLFQLHFSITPVRVSYQWTIRQALRFVYTMVMIFCLGLSKGGNDSFQAEFVNTQCLCFHRGSRDLPSLTDAPWTTSFLKIMTTSRWLWYFQQSQQIRLHRNMDKILAILDSLKEADPRKNPCYWFFLILDPGLLKIVHAWKSPPVETFEIKKLLQVVYG